MFLENLINQLEEAKFFASLSDFNSFQVAQDNLKAMINSINHSDDFFNDIFKDKTQSKILKWIELEAMKW